MSSIPILTALSIALTACGTNHMTNTRAMEDHLVEAEQELDRHHGAVMAAAMLPDVVSEAGMHDSKMRRVMDGMDDAMGGMMSHCSGGGMSEMHAMVTSMESQMNGHAGALENARDVGFAQMLCDSHVTEMREMLSTMHDALGRAGCRMMGW